jgi:murein DD-endopeptidase MepM/ murein hydrolase activator NlpD
MRSFLSSACVRLGVAIGSLMVFVACQGEESESMVSEASSDDEGVEYIADGETVLFASDISPVPLVFAPDTKICFVPKGTRVRLKEHPNSESDEGMLVVVEMLESVPQASPSQGSAYENDSFANTKQACPFKQVWMDLNVWRSLSDPNGSTDGNQNPIDVPEEKENGDGFAPRYPFNQKLPTCAEAGGGTGAFGASRMGGRRKHAGCDIYGSVGTPIVAIEEGVVIAREYSFYCGTNAIEVRHPSGRVMRYGEIQAGSAGHLSQGEQIQKGQMLAKIGKLSCYTQAMLHFEMYSGSKSGPLSQGSGGFMRRGDLVNPSQMLLGTKTFVK